MSEQATPGIVTELRARGYAVLPAPRRVELDGGCVQMKPSWEFVTDVDDDDIAVRTFLDTLRAEHGLTPKAAGGDGRVRFCVEGGAVATGLDDSRQEQAYRLEITPAGVEVTGNGLPGLFYGMQTLLQLLEGDGARPLVLPTGTITDWPEIALRILHWDTKHHLDRPETLRRYLDWAARFKVNGICYEIEDKFEYPSHPIIGGPGAWKPAQLQELADYGLQRHIQIIPNVQAPAHLGYVLKHEQFAGLRCDGSNYQICMDEPEARKLLFEMYADLVNATKGVKYFLVSTDEVYYAGICEKFRKPYNPENRSLTWVDYTNAAHEFLTKLGREVIVWLEYPVLAEHVKLLPDTIINGVLGPTSDESLAAAMRAHGIRSFIYCPIQGGDHFFPGYLPTADGGALSPGRVAAAHQSTRPETFAKGNVIGSFCAAWGDCGLHNETFWLGWAAMAQGSWNGGAACPAETTATFMDVYYGREVDDMVEVYRDLQAQARFWAGSWDRRPSKVRPPAYGNSWAKQPRPRSDRTLLAPALPGDDLAFQPAFRERYKAAVAEAAERLAQNDRLLGRLHANLARADRNRYNLEVLLSVGHFIRHHIEMLLAVAKAEGLLAQAFAAAEAAQAPKALALAVDARAKVAAAVADRRDVFARLTAVWEKSRFPKNAAVDGKEFLHVMDDVKDHPADRRVDLSYLTAPEESIGLAGWCEALDGVIERYAAAHGLEVQASEEAHLED